MKLYHTSDREVTDPSIIKSRKYLDFGHGLYTTSSKSQALKYAKRFWREGRPAVLNVYEYDENVEDCNKKKTFNAYDSEWLNYVVLCRREEPHQMFDVVEGGIADDDIFNTLDLYMQGLIEKEEAIKRLKKKKPNWQICFCSQDYIDKHLHFVESIQLTQE